MKYREYRYPCRYPVTVWLNDRPMRAVIINVSQNGARLADLSGVTRGDALRIEIGTRVPAYKAQVRWTDADRIGVRFDQALDSRSLALLRKSPGHASSRSLMAPGRERPHRVMR